MKILELFAGSRSIGKAAESLGYEVFSCDINAFDGINHVGDILDFDRANVPFIPDAIWASPPCTGFSVAALGHHWTGGKNAYIPATETAKLGIAISKKTVEIINEYKRLNPDLIWYIENPRGLLRKMPYMVALTDFNNGIRHTVTYCQYGDIRMKPTDIWTNSLTWHPKPKCKNGDSCHEAAPRGSKTGTQGLKGAYDRSKMPAELCMEIMASCQNSQINEIKQTA